MKRRLSRTAAWGAAAALLGLATQTRAHGPVAAEVAGDLAAMVEKANLVFVGDVADVTYRIARIEGGEGELPYTIVTYKVRQVLRGKLPGGTVTLRFPGGSDRKGHFMQVSGVPAFQPGEQDLLFATGHAKEGCPLVECEWGRYRILKSAVYNTHGSPVRAIDKSHAIARGLPPLEFRTFRYPTPAFDDLLKNPEVKKALQDKGLSVDEARRRYVAEAPKQIEVLTAFAPEPRTIGGGQTAGKGGVDSKSEPVPVTRRVELPPGPVALTRFLTTLRAIADASKRPPEEFKNADRDAVFTVRLDPGVAPVLPEPKIDGPHTPEEEAELRALRDQDFNPVIKR